MKIKNIAAICKKNKYAVIYERYGESGGVIQYIGDGAAAYPVTGLPKPLQTRRGLVFIESRYLSPVSDILDVLELYERITPRGTPYIVAKAGFLLQAVITPYDVISQQFVDNLKRLTEQCVLSLDLRDREKALAHAAEPEQYSLNVDPATGEIVEGESEVADNE
ncbi:MAG: hypothetical protein ACLUD9_00220 [Anaerotignum faecicola]